MTRPVPLSQVAATLDVDERAPVRSLTLDRALLALETELREWPGFLIEEIGRGITTGSRGPNDEVGPDFPYPDGVYPSPWEELNPDWWYVIAAARTGWQHQREHYQGHATTLLEAIDNLTTELVSRRTEPHRWHVQDWMQEGRFVVGCSECEREAHELFEGEVEWEPA